MLEFFKVIVQPVVVERNAEGKVIGEKLGEPTALYDRDQLIEFYDKVEQSIKNENNNIVIPREGELDASIRDSRIADQLR